MARAVRCFVSSATVERWARLQATLDDCSEELEPSNVRCLDATDPHPEKRELRLSGAGASEG